MKWKENEKVLSRSEVGEKTNEREDKMKMVGGKN